MTYYHSLFALQRRKTLRQFQPKMSRISMSDSEYTEESFEIPDELALDNVHPNMDMDEELQFQDNILQQTEKIYDVIEELDLINNANWSSTKFHPEALKKLNFIKEKLTIIYKDSIGTMEFEDRENMKDQEGYEYISMISSAWETVKKQLALSKQIVSQLPLDSKHASLREKMIKRIAKKEIELKKRSHVVENHGQITSTPQNFVSYYK